MANKNTPAHDFAPAWLKIPSYDTAKPSGADGQHSGHTSRRDEHVSSFVRHTKENNSISSHHHFTDSRRERDALSGERKPSYISSYHHSLDFNDSQYPINNTQYYCGDNSINGSSFNSQPALLRRPHSRHDFRNIPASYAKVDTLTRIANNNSYYGNKPKSKIHESCSNSSSGHNSVSRGIGVISNNFNQEFPSLQGDVSEEPPLALPAVNGSVWEKPRNMKIHSSGIGKKIQLVKKPISVDASSENVVKGPASPSGSTTTCLPSASNPHTVIITPIAKGGSGIYRALVPAKSSFPKKGTKDGMTKIAPKKSSITSLPSTHSMEILVKHPKAPGNKSEFLKALRNENKGMEEEGRSNNSKDHHHRGDMSNDNAEGKREDSEMNGIDIAKLSIDEDNKKPLLSSSLEAEERLLREMGWKEEALDDDNYAPLTEDELREFREIKEKIGKKNGIRRSLQLNVSPRRLAPFTNVSLPADSYSSSESDSD